MDEYEIKPTSVTQVRNKKMIIWAKEYILNPGNNDKIITEINQYLKEYILDSDIPEEYDIIVSEVITIRKKMEKEEIKKMREEKIRKEQEYHRG